MATPIKGLYAALNPILSKIYREDQFTDHPGDHDEGLESLMDDDVEEWITDEEDNPNWND